MNKHAANAALVAVLLVAALTVSVLAINHRQRNRSGAGSRRAVPNAINAADTATRMTSIPSTEKSTRLDRMSAQAQPMARRSTSSTSPTTTDLEAQATAVDDLVASRTRRLDELSEQLRRNPESVRALFDMMRSETDPEMIAMLAEVIAGNAAIIGTNMPVDELLKMAQADELDLRRAAALRILGKATNVTPEIMQAVFAISQADDNKEMRVNAICASSFWMTQYPQHKDLMYAELLKARNAAFDPVVRGFAIQTVAMQGDPLQGEMLEAITETLRTDDSSMNRNLAALGLALGARAETQAQVIAELEAAYNRETDIECKRIMMTQIVRAGMAQSAEVLARLDFTDAQLRQDATEWTQLLHAGAVEFDSIWNEKTKFDGARGTPIGGTDQP